MKEFNYKKKFGQNFLKDDRIVNKIVSETKIPSNTLVVEVGPGKGILTRELSKVAKNVICYEIDEELEGYLIELQSKLGNVKVIFSDFLTRDISTDLNDYTYDNLYFVSNVPYYITTSILMKIMSSENKFDKITMMIQKEVGERFSAKPCTKAYSSITVFLNYYYDIKKLFNVSRNEFVPVPNVDSVVISLTSKNDRLSLKNEKHFFELVRESFKFKRKTIRNNLKKYDLDTIESVLLLNGFSLSSRAEELPLEVFVEISNALN